MGEFPTGGSVDWRAVYGSQVRTARELLELPAEGELTAEQVTAAYRATLKRHHPDTGDNAHSPAVIRKWRDAVLAELNQPKTEGPESHESVCKTCGGSGRVGLGFGMQCAACGGTGEA